MRGLRCAFVGASLAALVGWFALSSVAPSLAQDPPLELPPGAEVDEDQEEGVEVQGRGAIHEAFAEPNEDAAPGYICELEPPQAVDELPPEDQPDGDNVTWINGYWMWDEDQEDFVWISGVWRDIPPGQRWVPGHWSEADGGHQWVSGFWAAEEQEEMEYLPAPPETLEQGPNVVSPGDEHFWIPGCWVHSTGGYRWRAGYYAPIRENWVWCPAHYVWTPCGCVFVDGYWDYRLPYRGVLFAPVCFRRHHYLTPGYCYTPRVCVSTGPLLIHLFVRPRCRHYYYGDYYGDTYVGLGFHPWHTHCVRHHDPLFVYYDWHYRHRGHSLSVVVGQWHVHYHRHADLRPPRAYVNNAVFINKTKVVNKTYVNNAVLTQNFKHTVANKTNKEFSFKKVSDNQRQVLRKQAENVRDLGNQRGKLEGKGGFANAGGSNGNKSGNKLSLPKVAKSSANNGGGNNGGNGGGNNNSRNKAPEKPKPNQSNVGGGNNKSNNNGNNNNPNNKGGNNNSNNGPNKGNNNGPNNDPNKGNKNPGNNSNNGPINGPNKGNNNGPGNNPNKGGNNNDPSKGPKIGGGNPGNPGPKVGGGGGIPKTGGGNPPNGGGGFKPPKTGGNPGFNPNKGGGGLPGGLNPPRGGSGGGRPPRTPAGGGSGGGSGGKKDRR